ncbi:hypothetical protein Tco_0312559 [Tanacetum coccineum]
MDLKLDYQTFRAKPTKSLSQTYTRYKTLLNELANDGVNLSKHEINVGFVNSLFEKWLTFSQGLRNANHNQSFDLADIYGRFVYKDNLIQRRYSDTKEALMKTPSKEHPSHTEGEHVTMEDNIEKPKSDKAEEEQIRAVPISVVRPIIRPNPKVAMIESSSRPPLTDPTLEILVPQREGKGISTDEQLESTKKLVLASKVIREDPDEPIRVPYIINGKMHYITNDEINAHLEKEDKINKAAEEAKMFEMTKTEVIKVVQEKAEKIGLDPKTIISAKAGEKFKKSHDAEHQVLKREHSSKAKRAIELRKKRFEQYMWTTSGILRPEPITDVKIHPNTKPVVLTVYRATIEENFKCIILSNL